MTIGIHHRPVALRLAGQDAHGEQATVDGAGRAGRAFDVGLDRLQAHAVTAPSTGRWKRLAIASPARLANRRMAAQNLRGPMSNECRMSPGTRTRSPLWPGSRQPVRVPRWVMPRQGPPGSTRQGLPARPALAGNACRWPPARASARPGRRCLAGTARVGPRCRCAAGSCLQSPQVQPASGPEIQGVNMPHCHGDVAAAGRQARTADPVAPGHRAPASRESTPATRPGMDWQGRAPGSPRGWHGIAGPDLAWPVSGQARGCGHGIGACAEGLAGKGHPLCR